MPPRRRRLLHVTGALSLVVITGVAVALMPTPPARTPAAHPRALPETTATPEPTPTPDPTPTPEPTPPPARQLLFADNFSGPAGAPAASWWSHRNDPWGNSSSDDLARLAGNGILDVLPGGLLGTTGSPSAGGFEIPHVEGRTYRAEARLKMPTTKGNHASFWLRTFFPDAVAELDVVESWNEFGCPTNVTFYWLYDEDKTDNRVKPCIATHVPDPAAWHTYAVEFTYGGAVAPDTPTTEQGATRFYVDDILVATIYLGPVRGTDPAAPAAEFLNLQNKLNHAAAVVTGGDPRMQVDWVKVYALGAELLPPVISPLETSDPTATGIANGPTALPYVVSSEISDTALTSWSCTLDGAPLACADPRQVTLGVLPFGGHTLRIDVANAAGSDSWHTSWTGGQPPVA